jgi:hypothetical protein
MKEYTLLKGAYSDPDDIGPAIDNYMMMAYAGDYQYMPEYAQDRLYNVIVCWLDDNIDDVAFVLLNREALPDMVGELEGLIREEVEKIVNDEFNGEYRGYWEEIDFDAGEEW